MNDFEGCRYYQRTLTRKYTMSVERENVVLNRKLSQVLNNQNKVFRDLQEAQSNVRALEFEVENSYTTIKGLEDEVEDLHKKVYYLETDCDPENDPYEIVEDVRVSPIVLTTGGHRSGNPMGMKILIHRGSADECEESENEGETTEEENLEPAENEVNEEPALDMSVSDYEKEEEEECEVNASGECECVKSVGVLEVADWTYKMPWSDIARY